MRGPLRPRVLLVINHGANAGRAARQAPRIRGYLREAGVDVDVIDEADAASTIAAARAALPDPGDPRPSALVVAGGDGAVHVGLQAVAGTDVALGIVPTGSGNDIVRDLGLAGATPRAAVTTILEALHAPLQPSRPAHGLDTAALRPGATTRGVVRRLDAMRVTTSGPEGPGASERWALAIASAGLDAAINKRTNELRWPPGPLRYLRALGEHLGSIEPYGYRLTLDGEVSQRPALLAAIANLRHFGGGMRIAPDADATDGLLDVVLVDPIPLATLARVFPRIYRGTHVTHPAVHVVRAREIEVAAWPEGGLAPSIVMADGEELGRVPVRVRVEPGAVSLVARTVVP